MAAANKDSKVKRFQGHGPATVYDAVAGRVGYESFLTARPPDKNRDRGSGSRSLHPVTPDEVLFRRLNAPSRNEEHDIYDATRHLSPSQRLPDSSMLKAIHAYASDYYAAQGEEHEVAINFRSMDETALLAMGILLEEAARKSLADNPDLELLKVADDEMPRSRSRHRTGQNETETELDARRKRRRR